MRHLMRQLQNAIDTLKSIVSVFIDGIGGAFERTLAVINRPSAASLTSVKWMSSRYIRRQYFADQFESNPNLFDEEFANAIDKKREEAEKQFLKVALIQITITGFMLLALMKA